MRVARNKTTRQWILAVGPDISSAVLRQRENAARETAEVRALQQEKDEMMERAEALEAQAKALRKQACSVHDDMTEAIKRIVGPACAYTATYDFQCDDETYSALAALSEKQVIDRLLKARGTHSEGLTHTDTGHWGDMTLATSSPLESLHDGSGTGWTKIGAPGWLNELFPNWNDEADEKEGQ